MSNPPGYNLFFAHEDYVSLPAATLTGSNFSGTAPVANLANDQTRKLARRNAADGTMQVTLDIGIDRQIGAVALLNHNATAVADWRIEVSRFSNFPAGDTWVSRREGTRERSVPMVPALVPFGSEPWGEFPFHGRPSDEVIRQMTSGSFLRLPGNGARGRYVRVTVLDSANDDPLQAGRLIVTRGWSPTRNFGYGWDFDFIDDSVREVTPGGASRVDLGDRRLIVRFSLPGLHEPELFQIIRLLLMNGKHTPFLFALRPLAAHPLMSFAMFGVLNSWQPVSNPFHRTHAWSVEIEEWR